MLLYQSVHIQFLQVLILTVVSCNWHQTQGHKWYAQRLRIDEDWDIADEFFHEFLQDTSHYSHITPVQLKSFPRYQVKSNVRHVKVRDQRMAPGGKFQNEVVCQGQLQWV